MLGEEQQHVEEATFYLILGTMTVWSFLGETLCNLFNPALNNPTHVQVQFDEDNGVNAIPLVKVFQSPLDDNYSR